MFYNLPFDKDQIDASLELEKRGWKYNKACMRWFKSINEQSNNKQKNAQKSV